MKPERHSVRIKLEGGIRRDTQMNIIVEVYKRYISDKRDRGTPRT